MLGVSRLQKALFTSILAVIVGVTAHAQITSTPNSTLPPGQCTGGPFTLTAGEVKFHVALDDVALGLPMTVTLRLYNAQGTVVARRTVTLAAGTTASLGFRGAGLLRAQATFGSVLNPSDRRQTVASVEIFDVDDFRAVTPVQCGPNENIGR